MSSRAVAPSNQWREPNARKVAAHPVRLYPALHASGVWGWTEVASEADGIIGLYGATGVLGVDDSTTIGGARVLDFGGEIVAIVTS